MLYSTQIRSQNVWVVYVCYRFILEQCELQKLIKHVLRMTNDSMYLAEGHGYLCGIPSTGILQDNCSSWVVCTFFVAVGYVHFFKCAEKMVLAMLIVVKV